MRVGAYISLTWQEKSKGPKYFCAEHHLQFQGSHIHCYFDLLIVSFMVSNNITVNTFNAHSGKFLCTEVGARLKEGPGGSMS